MNSTFNALRNGGFWVTKGRMAVRQVLDKCVICKRINAMPFKYPRVTDFVADKVNLVRPYYHTGIDFTGHLFVTFGDLRVKVYMLVFTCLSVRAVHIELLPDMSANSVLFAIIRFCNIYCIPHSIYSDNAPSFTQVCGILNRAMMSSEVSAFFEKNSIRHIKIPVYSAWIGAAWERSIKTIKSCLYKAIGRKKLSYFQLLTTLSDIQEAINNRPLTYYSSTDPSLDIVTPNSFLKPSLSQSLSFGHLEGSELRSPNHKDILSSLSRREDTLEQFKTLWHEQYLLSLRENSRDVYSADWIDRIKTNDIVLIGSPVDSRPFWKLGRVQELLTGSDGRTRCARVRRHDSTVEVYSISNLYPLELSTIPSPVVHLEEVEDMPRRVLPHRKAAQKCKERLQLVQ